MNNKAEALREKVAVLVRGSDKYLSYEGAANVNKILTLCAEVARSCVKERCKYRSDVIGFEIIEDINDAFGVSNEEK